MCDVHGDDSGRPEDASLRACHSSTERGEPVRLDGCAASSNILQVLGLCCEDVEDIFLATPLVVGTHSNFRRVRESGSVHPTSTIWINNFHSIIMIHFDSLSLDTGSCRPHRVGVPNDIITTFVVRESLFSRSTASTQPA